MYNVFHTQNADCHGSMTKFTGSRSFARAVPYRGYRAALPESSWPAGYRAVGHVRESASLTCKG